MFPRLTLLISFLLLLSTAAAQIPPPQMTFALERRQYYFPDADLATTTTMRLEATEESIRERGFTHGHLDPATGLAYIRRLSLVDTRITPEGELLYLEQLPRDAPWDYSDKLHQLILPLGAEPHRTINPLMALHPYTMIAPEFEYVRALNLPDVLSRDTEPGLEVVYTPDWTYRIHSDLETGRVTRIEQIEPRHNWLFRETRFDDYQEAPSGRILPRTVRSRTYFEGVVPYAELIFTNIMEMSEPEFRGNPAAVPDPRQ